MGMGPAVLRGDDLRGDAEGAVEVLDVGFGGCGLGPNRFADVHVPLYSTKLLVRQHKYSFIIVTILQINAFRAGPLKQNQRLASRPQADATVKSLCKGGSWASRRLSFGQSKARGSGEACRWE